MKESGLILNDCGKDLEVHKIMIVVVRADEDVTFEVADKNGGDLRLEIEILCCCSDTP